MIESDTIGQCGQNPAVEEVVLLSSPLPYMQAAYLAKAGKKVVVLERRHVLGGAAVTEEIVPGRCACIQGVQVRWS